MGFRAPCLVVFLSAALALAQNPTVRSTAIEGTVTNSVTGDPIPDARIKLARQQYEPDFDFEPMFGHTDGQGHFRLFGLGPGTYDLSVQRPGFLFAGGFQEVAVPVNVMPSRLATVTTPKPGVKITKTPGSDGIVQTAVEIQLTPAAVIMGKVTDPNGTPVGGAYVRILDATVTPAAKSEPHAVSPVAAQAATDDLGEFRFGRLQPGTYYVVVDRPYFLEESFRSTYFPHSLDAASANPVELAAGQHARADIQMMRLSGVRVAGRIVPAGETPVNGRTRMVLLPRQTPASGSFSTHRADTPVDTFELRDVLPGAYTLFAATFADDSFGGIGKPLLSAIQQVDVAGRDLTVAITMRASSDLTGTVTFEPGCSPSPVQVIANGDYWLGRTYADAVTASDGKFTLSGMIPGRYTLRIMPTGAMASMSARMGGRDVSKESFEYPPSEPAPLEIVLGCGSSRRAQ